MAGAGGYIGAFERARSGAKQMPSRTSGKNRISVARFGRMGSAPRFGGSRKSFTPNPRYSR